MKVVILAGGLGTRISEESHLKPKPMISIGDRPILWHIMKIYSYYGFNDFIICLGYKGYVIKEYFSNYFLHESDVTFDFKNQNEVKIHRRSAEPWRVSLVETGKDSMTGGRVKRIQKYVGDDSFMLTYGDGVSDINILELVNFHHSHGKIATVTAVQPTGRFGAMSLSENGTVLDFMEKPKGDGGWINGGFFIFQPDIFNYLDGDHSILEKEPLEKLTQEGQLQAYQHNGFWYAMDTLRDRNHLEELWKNDNAPWKRW
ncbi:glucose-1-phosphate cytidylyltransferase [Oikeobacillus pervagus]|uniref:Glucose-1-phosphate cytidylyltransferase n=1 Tax=Oikeobacillus pervagus TaxID=1325931 RepID=A0AAJ1T455_9BACI|nr:glucose-1-phosphate cytidylyltransferase [Oikeobacillus pervagus]MDQ0216412.1 glucose-1-phosphate cytidylyltransferase [Oikeobacillus pervagus]